VGKAATSLPILARRNALGGFAKRLGRAHRTTPEMQHGLCRGGITWLLRKQRASGAT
jgi:hypothetical protein